MRPFILAVAFSTAFAQQASKPFPNEDLPLRAMREEMDSSRLLRGAGLELPYGCREGICHTCAGELRSGQVRDLRNGKVYGQEGEVIRTCISAPEGRVEIDL